MLASLSAIFSQLLLFLPLAFAISISFNVLRATDMTLDGSFVLGAAVFAQLISLSVSPIIAALMALFAGACAGMLTAFIQRHDRVDPLLAGILATFILSSMNLCVMGKPNINLLSKVTLVSSAFAESELRGWGSVAFFAIGLCLLILLIIQSRLGLLLRAFGDNPALLKRMGKPIETLRMFGFAITNLMAAGAGCLTAQTIGYADVGMGLGVTLTGIGAIILGQQIFSHFFIRSYYRIGHEFLACFVGVTVYFALLNLLLKLSIDPIYLKLLLGLLLIFFLRAAKKPGTRGMAT